MTKCTVKQKREELAGLLTAISIVSRRLAENIKKLDAGKENTRANATAKSPC